MKKLFIFIIFIIFNYKLNSWEQFTPKNSNLKSPSINKLFKTINNEVIYISNKEIGFIKNNEILSDTNYRSTNLDIYPFINCVEDKFGNLIFRGNNAIGVFYTSTKKWQMITDKTIPSLLYNSSIVKIVDDIYLNVSKPNTLYNLEYNETLNTYNVNTENPIMSNNLLSEFGNNMCYLDSMFIFANYEGIVFYDLKTNNVQEINKVNNISLGYNNLKSSLSLYVLENKLIIALKTIDSTVNILISDSNLRNEYVFKELKYTTSLSNPQNFIISDIDLIKDNQYIVSCVREMLILENGNFYKLKTPSFLGEDINKEWLPRTTEIKGDTVYIGTFQGGIFKCSIEELLALKIETSIENENYSTMQNGLINTFPIPLTDKVQIDFFMKDESVSNLKVELFGLSGEQILNINSDITNMIGETFQLTLDIGNLPKGTYLVKIIGKNSSIIQKVIK